MVDGANDGDDAEINLDDDGGVDGDEDDAEINLDDEEDENEIDLGDKKEEEEGKPEVKRPKLDMPPPAATS